MCFSNMRVVAMQRMSEDACGCYAGQATSAGLMQQTTGMPGGMMAPGAAGAMATNASQQPKQQVPQPKSKKVFVQ